jgi:RIO kinase 1
MDTSRNIKYYNDLDDEGTFDWPGKSRERRPKSGPTHTPIAIQQFVQSQDDTKHSFDFSYHASRHEQGWLLNSLGGFYEHKWISDVVRLVKGGKEASVYLCKAGVKVGTEYLAAKVYRPRKLRNLKNDQLYRIGRADLDEFGNKIDEEGMLKAMRLRSAYGEELRHQSWIAYEYVTLELLHAAGADVPQPYGMEQNAILMDYIGDPEMAAPTLNSIDLDQDEAKLLFDCVLCNIDLMLTKDRIHADLSAFNILYWEGIITLIDFPQVVRPATNPLAWRIFERDVRRICEYFATQGVHSNPTKIAADLWTAHGHKLMTEVHPRDLDPENPNDRRIWQKQAKEAR